MGTGGRGRSAACWMAISCMSRLPQFCHSLLSPSLPSLLTRTLVMFSAFRVFLAVAASAMAARSTTLAVGGGPGRGKARGVRRGPGGRRGGNADHFGGNAD